MTKYARFRNAYHYARRKHGTRRGAVRYGIYIARSVGAKR